MKWIFVRTLGDSLIETIEIDKITSIIGNINIILLIYFGIFYIALNPALYFLFKKEQIETKKAFIPGYNLYLYFKLINIPWYLLLIPYINLVTLYISVYKLAKLCKAPMYLKILSFIIPEIPLLLICCNNKYMIIKTIKKEKAKFLKSVADIDKLEQQLENTPYDTNYDEPEDVASVKNTFYSYKETKINEIEANAYKDNMLEDLEMIESSVKEEPNVEIMDSNEKEEILDINNSNIIDMFDNSEIQPSNGVENIINTIDNQDFKVIDNAEYKDFKEEQKDDIAIAFGGINQDDKVLKNRIESSDKTNVCPHCSTILKVDSNICPGCGKTIN